MRYKLMSSDEQKIFANALRECLGLGPLYGDAEHPGEKKNGGKQRRKAREAEELACEPEAAE